MPATRISTVKSFERRPTMQPERNTTWDPGIATLDPYERIQLYKIKVHFKIYTLLANACGVDINETGTDEDEDSRSELDSHANMPVVGQNAYVISDTGKVADVSVGIRTK
jgi:hypothetical protein